MKRPTLAALLVVAGVSLYVASSHSHRTETPEREQRNVRYQSTLRSYQDAFPIGVNRGQVEKYLASKAMHYEHIHYPAVYTHSDLVEIGTESSPWSCSRTVIYIEFQFSTGSHHYARADSADQLEQIALYKKLQDCL